MVRTGGTASRSRRPLGWVVVVALFALVLTACDWPMFHSDSTQSGVAADPGFSAAQATNLRQLWRFHPGWSIYSTPVTFHGVVYLGGGDGTLWAVNETTGLEMWHKAYGQIPDHGCQSPAGFVSSPAVRDDGNGNPLVYVYTPQGTLQELDGRNGDVVWEQRVFTPGYFATNGVSDYYPWSSPIARNGRVYVGVSSNCDEPFVRGALLSFDAATGAPIATAYMMPVGTDPNYANRNPKPPTTNWVGAGIWTSPAVDDNYVYLTTASTYDDINNAHPPTDTNQFDQYSMLKLDAATLQVVGKFAVPQPQSVNDPDWGSTPTLFTATIGGQSVPMVGACNKDGNYYAVRTDTMRPVWSMHVGLGTPYGQQACLTSAIWDGTNLYVTSNQTTVGGTWTKTTTTSTQGYSWPTWTPSGGTAANAAVRKVDPATGVSLSTQKPLWESSIQSLVLGSCSMYGQKDVIACQTMDWNDQWNAAVLISAANGAHLNELHDYLEYQGFSSPIWSDGKLIVSDADAMRAYVPA
jgi:outer membrane protein assembly factor BamB